MDPYQSHVMTIANSIIGVSILAMPFCFKQCGIILSIVLLSISSVISRLSCHFLLKSAIISRLRTFEFLAYHAFGSFGKFIVEIGLIGFLMGTCIAFFVVMGELAPEIVAEMTDTQVTSTLRNIILLMLALFCVLPLGLLRKVDSLSGVCTATIIFYITLVLKVIFESLPHIYQWDWIDKVEYWKPSGILQCLPIFSMALFCQTQLFEIYQAIPNASLEKMNGLIRAAVNICTGVYILVGIFGYVALSHQSSFTGNILLSFQPSIVTNLMKIGFVLSIAFSFPLIIFPCRASLYSLFYKRVHDAANNYIPERKFKILTLTIVFASLLVGVMIPNIELVLGLVGSTIGVMICVIFPATCFICIISKNTNERILAQIMLFTGIIVMVLGTYANLYAFEEVTYTTERPNPMLKMNDKDLIPGNLLIAKLPTTVKIVNKLVEEPKEIRHEPPQPEEPVEPPVVLKADIQVPKEVVTERLPKIEVPANVSQKTEALSDNKGQKVDEVDVEAIKKEDTEIREVEKLNEDKGKESLKMEVDQKLDQFQQQINELKMSQQEEIKVNQKKLKTFKEIELLARKAIETLTNDVSNKQLLAKSVTSADNNAAAVKHEIVKTAEIDKEKQQVVVVAAAVENKNEKMEAKIETNNELPANKINQVPKNSNNLGEAVTSINPDEKLDTKRNIANDKEVKMKAIPLSYQLGLNKNVISPDIKTQVKSMLPIPLASLNYSKVALAENQSIPASVALDKPKEQQHQQQAKSLQEIVTKRAPEEVAKKTENDMQSIGRDILSNDRQKRDTLSENKDDEEHCEKRSPPLSGDLFEGQDGKVKSGKVIQ